MKHSVESLAFRDCELPTESDAEFGHALVDPATLDKPIEEQKMVGSFIVFEAPSLEECKKIIEDDIYYKTGVVCILVATPVLTCD